MPRTVIAVTDSPFPSLDPAKKALARLDPEYRMAKSPSAEDILAVARDADAILVTYAKLSGQLLRQLKKCKAIGRFGLGVDNIDLPAAKELGIAVNYVPDYCLREVSDHAMALLLGARPQGDVRQQARAIGPLGGAAARAAAPARRPGAGADRLRQHPARAGAQGQGVRIEGHHLRSLREPGRARRNRRRKRKLRRFIGALRFHLGARAAAAGDARADERKSLRQDEKGRLPDQHRARPAGRRGRACRRARFRPSRRRRARRGDDRTAGQGFPAASAATT